MAVTYFTVSRLSTKDLIRFFSKVDFHTGRFFNGTRCWHWTAMAPTGGYGRFKWKSDSLLISRFVYAWLIEPVPSRESGLEVDHLCKNPRCCNPLHLELVPKIINMQRSDAPPMRNSRKSHCDYGHPFSTENTLTRIRNGRRTRECRQCAKERFRSIKADPVLHEAYKARIRAAARRRQRNM